MPRSTAMSTDLIWRLAAEGRIFVASDADENDLVTGQTSFAATTPTFLLQVPAGTICVPLGLTLAQTGSVAGGAIVVIVYVDNTDRYSSGGTSELVFNPNGLSAGSAASPSARTNLCTFYSNPTAIAGVGARLWAATIGQDVSPAEGGAPGPSWAPPAPLFLTGPASLLVFTYAGTTGPTWFWSATWAEFPAGSGIG